MLRDHQATLDELDRDECLRLLATQSLGRLAVSRRLEPPLVVPVNYVVDGANLVFRSGYGTKLRSLAARPVSFQVDWVDPVTRTGWSVLAHGRAREIRQRDAGPRLPEPWMPEDKPYLVRMAIHRVTGRRIVRAEDPVDG
ncbi:MAG: pyridoxamine 5'-phosphate oxidase family protein [Acidimicrobiales bacterium]